MKPLTRIKREYFDGIVGICDMANFWYANSTYRPCWLFAQFKKLQIDGHGSLEAPPPHDIVGRGTCFGGLGLLNVYACRIPVSSYKHKTFQSGCKIQVQKSKAISIPVGFYVK